MMLRALLWPGAAAFAGWWLHGADALQRPLAALAAAGAACWCLWLLERGRTLRLRHLLRRGQAAAPGRGWMWGGVWVENLARIERIGHEFRASVGDVERRLHELFSALNASPNAVVLLDAQQRIEWCNHQASSLLGLEGARDRGQSIQLLLRDPAFVAHCASPQGEIDMQHNGLPLAVQLHPYGNDDGGGQRWLLLARDTSAMQRARSMQRDFVANVSHEIRTPLSVLAGFVETLQTLDLDEATRQRCLHTMAQQAARMQRLVQDLLHLAELEAGSAPQNGQWLPLVEVVRRCREHANALRETLGAPHQLQFPDPQALDGEILADAHELHSALANLLDNALRHTPGGVVVLAWEWLGDGAARCVLRDSGAGIAPEHLAHLTRRFYRVDAGRSRGGGSGLGLAIAQHALQRHGARLRIASEPGRGAEFSIVFPASRLRPGISPSSWIDPAG